MKPMKAQMKIQQMAFMIVAVFFFFILVGLFFLSWQSKSLTGSFENLQKEQALSSLEVIANMPELNCDSRGSWCVDEDKLNVMSSNLSGAYDSFWPVASVKVYKVYPSFESSGAKLCPSLGCNYWKLHDSTQNSAREYSGYVSICKKIKEFGYVYDKCDIGKLVVGVDLGVLDEN